MILFLCSFTSNAAEITLTNDFNPPQGKVQGPGKMGPWNTRLMSAVSKDGLHFTRTNQVITDQGDVPDLVIDQKGWLYLYYTGWTVGTEHNKTVVAISTDVGKTWHFKKLILSGFEKMAEPVDPDVQFLSDDSFRLYVTSDSGDGRGPRSYYAESRDGIHFTKKGVAFESQGRAVLDPSTLKTDKTWIYFAGGRTQTPGANWFATSSDGKTFKFKEDLILIKDGQRHVMANGIKTPKGYRFYAFNNNTIKQASRINSFFSTDGMKWHPEPGIRLVLDDSKNLESFCVKDPAVVRLKDGGYFMVYVTMIP